MVTLETKLKNPDCAGINSAFPARLSVKNNITVITSEAGETSN